MPHFLFKAMVVFYIWRCGSPMAETYDFSFSTKKTWNVHSWKIMPFDAKIFQRIMHIVVYGYKGLIRRSFVFL